LSGSLKYFYSHEFIHPTEHYIVQGYHGDMPYANEAYISPGSPEWACHAFAALMFDADDPLWTETEQPLPVERGDFELALPVPGLALSGNKSSGQVLLLNAGSGHLPENPRHHYVSKYGKLAYSTHFPFNVLPAPHSYAPDAMVALCDKEGVFSHRFMSRAYDVAPGMSWCQFVEVVDDDYQLLRVAIVVWRGLQVRLTRVLSSHRVRAFEAPGALGTTGAACVTRLSDLDEGWEYAEADGRALAIKRLWGYDAQQPSAPFLGYSNINLGYPYAEQPMVYERAPRLVTRNLAAATLLSPTPFNPSEAFAGVQVAANEQGAFYVSFRDGELAFVSLENVLPNKVRVGTLDVMGDGVRHVRVTAATKSVTALGADSIAGICALDRSGMLCLRRDDAGTVSITTDAGISLDSNWLNGDIAGVEVHDIDGAWSEITASCDENRIPHALVREWQKHNERTYIEFRVKVA
jgi:hypothetical protein